MLISSDSRIQGEVTGIFPGDFHLVVCNGDLSGKALLKDVIRGIVMVDTDSPDSERWLKKICETNSELVCVGVGKKKDKFIQLNDYLYDYFELPSEEWQLAKLLERAWEKTDPVPKKVYNPQSTLSNDINKTGLIDSERPWARILSDFSRAMSNQFNKERFLELFMDAVKELVPVGKIAILLKAPGCDRYTVSVQKGLDPSLLKQLFFTSDGGVISWLAEQGAILFREEAARMQENGSVGDLIQEMKLLNAEICLPLFVHNNLVGVLCLGKKITGDAFHKNELELLYSVCGNIAYVLNDLDLHERVITQKVYIESILQLMNSGVVAIDKSDKITIFNQRAAEIICTEADHMIGSDLRKLPSPLGDMLYESLLEGTRHHKKEVSIGSDKIPLEVSTYRMISDGGSVLGSVMIFDDIRARKKMEAEKLHSEQLEMLNSFVGQLTHEIKNPMVAIQTYAELLPEKYDDKDFRNTFSEMVNREIHRLNELVEQLIAFSSPLRYQLEILDVHDVLDMAVDYLNYDGRGSEVSVKKQYCGDQIKVKVDKTNLARALSYLLQFFSGNAVDSGVIYIKTACLAEGAATGMVNILITDSTTTVGKEQLDKLFDPLSIKPDSMMSLGLPVSKKIIEDHEGMLRVAQKNGSYLKFGVALPVFPDS